MTNDKDGAVLLPCPFCEAELSRQNDKDGHFWMHPGFITDESCFLSGRGVFHRKAGLWNRRTALKSHGQAFDAAGVREAIRALPYDVMDDYDEVRRDERERIINHLQKKDDAQWFATPNGTGLAAMKRAEQAIGAAISNGSLQSVERAYNILRDLIDQAIRALPIPEAPASVEPVADDVRRLVIAAREAWEVMGDCSADASYSANLDKALEAFSSRVLYENEPDTIGSHFGNGGGLDPVRSFHVEDLRETCAKVAQDRVQHLHGSNLAHEQHRAREARLIADAIRALPPVKQSVGKFQRGDHVEKISGSKWRGKIVGEYATELTPEGYAVESDTETGSVQIYPAKALRLSHDQRGGSGE